MYDKSLDREAFIMDPKPFSSPVFTLSMHNTVHDALNTMKTNFIKRVVIVKDSKPIGIVTERDISRFLEKDTTKRALDEITLKEIMKKNLITIQANQADHFEQCATRMITFKVGSIIVVDDEGRLAGITTQTDITAAFASTYSGKYKVKDYMTDKVVTCRETDSLQYALEIINKNDVSRLVVTDSKGIVKGVITTNTFLRHSEYFKENTKSRRYLLPAERADARTVSEWIESEILTVEQDEDLANAAALMIKNKVSGIPVIVMKDSKLTGVVSKFDVVRAYSNVIPHGKVLEIYRTYP
ncbi:MAG: CBS domain-containing protein [Candidatus Nitrosotenuis sp.]